MSEEIKQKAKVLATKMGNAGKKASNRFINGLAVIYIIVLIAYSSGLIPEDRLEGTLKITSQIKEFVTWFFVTVGVVRGTKGIIKVWKGNGNEDGK